jgi:hypothetical protein
MFVPCPLRCFVIESREAEPFLDDLDKQTYILVEKYRACFLGLS